MFGNSHMVTILLHLNSVNHRVPPELDGFGFRIVR